MNRKFWLRLKSELLFAFQFCVFCCSLVGFWPASARQPSSIELGGFLGDYPAGQSAELVRYQQLWRLGEWTFADYRIVLDLGDRHQSIVDDAQHDFYAECRGIGGKITEIDNPSDIVVRLAAEKAVVLNPTSSPVVCGDEHGRSLGALFAYNFWNASGDRYAALFVMTPEAATEMLDIYYQAEAKERFLRADGAKRQAADERRRSEWRANLAIGSETQCGAVVELRGPIVQVAYGTQAGWVRRERLYPPPDARPCTEFSGP